MLLGGKKEVRKGSRERERWEGTFQTEKNEPKIQVA